MILQRNYARGNGSKNKRLKGKWSCGSKRVQVSLKNGLQARPAALFVQEGQSLSCRYFHRKDGKTVNAKEHNGDYELSNWNW